MAGDHVIIMPAVKANAYGHGVIMACKALEEAGASVLAVGNIDEAIHVRKAGVKCRIVIFASNLVKEVADLYVKYDLTPTVMYDFQAKAISDAATAAGKKIGVYVKMETGRGRLGINSEEAPAMIREIAQYPGITVDGLYSHFAYAGWDESKRDYPNWQYERFTKALDEIESYGIHIPFTQLVNTPGGIVYQDMRLTGMCPGRGIWGYSPVEIREGEHLKDGCPDLKSAMTAWKSRLLIVKETTGGKFGENYAACRLEKPLRIGIVAAGVSDGIGRGRAKGYVLIHGKKAPVCVSMSLEHMTVDLTDIPEAQAGDEVVIMGKQGEEEITREQLMKLWGQVIPYFWTAIPEHVERVYYEGETPVAVARGYDIEML
ncbi:MAG TPA: alanine racemase [Lachnospiraceae bacterium]|nr:alanine racemase [Lachnospiraceae bacterium]